MSRHTRVRLLCVGCAIAVASILWFAIWPLMRIRGTERWEIALDGAPVTVSIHWSHDPTILDLKEAITIGGGNWRYRVEVLFQNGRRITFTLRHPPYALWYLGKEMYVACYESSEWHLARVSDDGTLTSVRRADLPEGPKPWNLVEHPHEVQNLFDVFAK